MYFTNEDIGTVYRDVYIGFHKTIPRKNIDVLYFASTDDNYCVITDKQYFNTYKVDYYIIPKDNRLSKMFVCYNLNNKMSKLFTQDGYLYLESKRTTSSPIYRKYKEKLEKELKIELINTLLT